MKRTKVIKTLFTVTLLLSASIAHAAVGFSREDLDLVKDACLAGSSYEFKTEADGSVSVKNLEGKGKLLVSKKDVTTADVPDTDKKEEFQQIRECVKSYLVDKPSGPKGNVVHICAAGDSDCCNSKSYFQPGECGAPGFIPH